MNKKMLIFMLFTDAVLYVYYPLLNAWLFTFGKNPLSSSLYVIVKLVFASKVNAGGVLLQLSIHVRPLDSDDTVALGFNPISEKR